MKNLIEAFIILVGIVAMVYILRGDIGAIFTGVFLALLFGEYGVESRGELEAESESVEATPSAGSYKPETNS